jgi:hypothetical protein
VLMLVNKSMDSFTVFRDPQQFRGLNMAHYERPGNRCDAAQVVQQWLARPDEYGSKAEVD